MTVSIVGAGVATDHTWAPTLAVGVAAEQCSVLTLPEPFVAVDCPLSGVYWPIVHASSVAYKTTPRNTLKKRGASVRLMLPAYRGFVDLAV